MFVVVCRFGVAHHAGADKAKRARKKSSSPFDWVQGMDGWTARTDAAGQAHVAFKLGCVFLL